MSDFIDEVHLVKILIFCLGIVLLPLKTLCADPIGSAVASSQAEGFEAFKAFDGTPETSWKAKTGEGPAPLFFTFSSSRTLQRIRTSFPSGRAFLYRIDISKESLNEKGHPSEWINVVEERVGKGTMTDTLGPIEAKVVKTTIRNLLPNSGFERGDILEDWDLVDGEVATEPFEVHTGTQAVRAPSGYLVMVCPIDLPVESRKAYTFSFYGRSPDKATGYLVILVEKDDGTSAEIEKSLGMFRPEYTFHRVSIFLPLDIALLKRANFYRFSQKGSIYYDDVFLIEGWVPTDIPEIREQTFE